MKNYICCFVGLHDIRKKSAIYNNYFKYCDNNDLQYLNALLQEKEL